MTKITCPGCGGRGKTSTDQHSFVRCMQCQGAGLILYQVPDENPFVYTDEQQVAINRQAAEKLVSDLYKISLQLNVDLAPEFGTTIFRFTTEQLTEFAKKAAELPALQDYASMYDSANWGLRERKVVSMISTAVEFVVACDDGAVFHGKDIEHFHGEWIECLPVPGTFAAANKTPNNKAQDQDADWVVHWPQEPGFYWMKISNSSRIRKTVVQVIEIEKMLHVMWHLAPVTPNFFSQDEVLWWSKPIESVPE